MIPNDILGGDNGKPEKVMTAEEIEAFHRFVEMFQENLNKQNDEKEES